jgi:hypothetical protein
MNDLLDKASNFGREPGEDDGSTVPFPLATKLRATRPAKPRRNETVTLSDVKAERLEFVWAGYVPRAKLSTLEGPPGVGKSTIAIDLGARFSAGRFMPGSLDPVKPGNVGILQVEDGIADTIKPRGEAAGADQSRIHVFKSLLSVPDDMRLIEEAVRDLRLDLLIIDPFAAFLSASIDSHKDSDVRRGTGALAEMAAATGCTVLVVRHHNKDLKTTSALHRGGGSIGIAGAARSVLTVGPDRRRPGEEPVLTIAQAKGNLSVKPSAYTYRIESVELPIGPDGAIVKTSRIEWLGSSDAGADDLVAAALPPPRASKVSEAQEFLRAELADAPRLTKDVEARAEDAGIRPSALTRARKDLGVIAEHRFDGQWQLVLPKASKASNTSKASSPRDVGHDAGLASETKASTKAPVSNDASLESLAPLARLGSEVAPVAPAEDPSAGWPEESTPGGSGVVVTMPVFGGRP